MFQGLSAFPLTPLSEDRIDEHAFRHLIGRLAISDVDSITVLGSTGSYAYLDRDERKTVLAAGVDEAGSVPVFAGIGALRTSHVLRHAEDAQNAGVSAVLLAPMSYQTLTHDDVLQLYTDVTAVLSVPLIVYDNPGTTHFTFTDELYASIARLPNVASIKIPGVPADPHAARIRVDEIRRVIPTHVSIGVSGDPSGAAGLNAGCDAWYSVIAGTLPDHPALITEAARRGDADTATVRSDEWQSLWSLFERHGSLRVTAAIAEHLGYARRSCLPRPVLGLDDKERRYVAEVLAQLEIASPVQP